MIATNFLVFALSITLIGSFSINANGQNATIFTPDEKPFGLTHQDWAIKYWQWLLSIPQAQTPMEDKIGTRCHNGQENFSMPVFFLTGGGGFVTDVDRTCEIPEGKGLFIMAESSGFSALEKPGITNMNDLRTMSYDAVQQNDRVTLKIDGSEFIKDKTRDDFISLLSPLYNVTIPPGAVFDIKVPVPTTTIAASMDIFVITKPLAKGDHFIHLTTFSKNAESRDIKYKIIVN